MDNNETRYLYSLNPKKVIKSLSGKALVPPISSPKSVRLSIEEVRECLKFGSVYRRFANEGRNERVLISNIERLHNEKFMTEEEYKSFLKGEGAKEDLENNRGKVVNTEPKKDETISQPDQLPEENGKVEETVNKDSEVKEEITEETKNEQPTSLPDERVEATSKSKEEKPVENIKVELKNETQGKSQKSPFVQQSNNKSYSGKNNKNK